MKAKFYFIIHNLIAHPLLVFSTRWAEKFHDWTWYKHEKQIAKSELEQARKQFNKIPPDKLFEALQSGEEKRLFENRHRGKEAKK